MRFFSGMLADRWVRLESGDRDHKAMEQ